MEKPEKKLKLSDFFRYIKYSYKYSKEGKLYLFIVFITNILLTIVSIVVPILSAQEIIKLTDGAWKELAIIALVLFGLEIFRRICQYIFSFGWNTYFYSVRKNIQLVLVDETLKITTDDLNNNSSGVFIERINNDTDTIANFFVEFFDYLSAIISSIGVYISVFFINSPIFFLYTIYIVVLFFLQKRSSAKVLEKRKIYKKNREKVNGFTGEMVRGAKDIKILNAEKSFLNHASKIMDESKRTGLQAFLTRAKYRFINTSVSAVLDLCINFCGLYFIIIGKLSVSALLIIHNYSGKIKDISFNIEYLLESINTFNLSASRIFGILEEDEFHKESFGTKHVKKLNGDIKFQNVTFKYDEDNIILNNMSFDIEANKTVAFVGRSGAGKSTIFNLISKLYDVNVGSIYLDSYDINTLDKDSIRANLSIISQNPYIYNMSIKENLKIIKSNATEKEIIEACKMACLHDFIISLKDGYDTIVGEGGVTLSGGQKQRLAIARAFLLKTKIILFDEATSALDNETQMEITKAIENMKGDYTVLIIAHRLSTVMNADKIFVVDKGKIIDSGTREYLLKNSRTFKKLYKTELESEK